MTPAAPRFEYLLRMGDSALVLARTVIAEIEEPRGEWPLVGDRMIKPESIVSVDVLTVT